MDFLLPRLLHLLNPFLRVWVLVSGKIGGYNPKPESGLRVLRPFHLLTEFEEFGVVLNELHKGGFLHTHFLRNLADKGDMLAVHLLKQLRYSFDFADFHIQVIFDYNYSICKLCAKSVLPLTTGPGGF